VAGVEGSVDQLIDVFSECLKVPSSQLNDSSSPDTVAGWDSLAAMNLVVALEERFSIKLSTREVMKMRTIGIARDVLKSKGVLGV
jgi:acyl carrier protein